jgi:hypothetical protein
VSGVSRWGGDSADESDMPASVHVA